MAPLVPISERRFPVSKYSSSPFNTAQSVRRCLGTKNAAWRPSEQRQVWPVGPVPPSISPGLRGGALFW
jgi:hypothetical protein